MSKNLNGQQVKMTQRSSGILLHITSLPSPYGIGDFGSEAYRFADFLAETKQRYWQILPLSPVEEEGSHSPYTSPSAFAGNTLLISPDLLVQEGYLEPGDIDRPFFPDNYVDFDKVIDFKTRLFEKAFQRFKHLATPEQKAVLNLFVQEHYSWLRDYCLYNALRKHLSERDWSKWPPEIRDRQPEVLKQAEQDLSDQIWKEQFLQFLFFKQWKALKHYCGNRNIHFFGDLPFYVSYHSVDVWKYPHYFKLDKNRKPKFVSGVPPDYFSKTGQLWGTPVYNWDKLKADHYDWWMKRIAQKLSLIDLLRLDHFRAFSAYWEVPADHKTAINGYWVDTPGEAFFGKLKKQFPDLPIIAEDLGDIDQDVRDLMKQFDFPGMKLLLFAFDESMPHNPYIPHNHIENCVVYTGTHDNNTVKGWYENEAGREDKKRLSAYSACIINKNNVHQILNRLAMMSVSRLVVLPMQDILGLGEEAIMNRPSTTKGNWKWRLLADQITPGVKKGLLEMTEVYGRGGGQL